MSKRKLINFAYNQALENKPFEKIEQFRLFDRISASHIENIEEDSYSDEFIDYWNNCASYREAFKARLNGLKFDTEDDLEDYLANVEIKESNKANWLIDYVLIKIPN